MGRSRTYKRDPYTWWVSHLVFPLHERLKGHSTVDVMRHMEKSQWWAPEQIEAHQLKRLRDLLAEAEERVPYYRSLFSSLSFRPQDIRSLADLRSIPLLSKEIIREQGDAMKASGATSLRRFNTGGSTGEPLIFYIGPERVSHDVAAKWRATRWWGVDIGDREVVIWGSPVELGAQDRFRELRDRLFRTKLFPAFEMSQDRLNEFVRDILNIRPRMLFGYPSALAHIARHAQRLGKRLDNLGIRVAFVTSERLYDDQRQLIQTAFGCPVANGYGGRDSGFIAHECPQGGMHVTAEDIIVEILDSNGDPVPPGEPGEIVVTHLATRDFPFVRYRTGDVGILSDEPCACGRGLPLLKEVQGRTTDFITASDGTVMHGLALIYVLRDLPGIEAFKIIQEDLRNIRVLLVAGESFEPERINNIATAFKARLGQDVNVMVERVSEIRAERSGKYRYVVSRVGA